MTRWSIIGPTYPFRGGIAHYTTLLTQHLRETSETLLISFTRQYPRWLFPGRSDKDPSQNPLRTEAEYLLDPLNPLSWRRTVHRLEAWEPEAVVIPWWVPFWAPTWAYLGWRIRAIPNRPKLIFICHNVLPHEDSWLDNLAIRLALSNGDGFIVHSESDAGNLLRLFPKALVRKSPHPTYAPLLGYQDKTLDIELPPDQPLLLFCGFVRHYKGLDILLEALPLVLAERTVHLLVAGEFWEDRGKYDRQIDSLKIGQSVTILNEYLANQVLAALISRSDVVVLPYRNASQSGLIQAAFGLGKPVITTDVGGLAEAVDDGRTGLIIPSEDPRALAAAVNQFFDEGLSKRFQENLAGEIARFSWEDLIHRLEEFIE